MTLGGIHSFFLGHGSIALSIRKQCAADRALPVGDNAIFRTGRSDCCHCLQSVTASARISGNCQLHVVNSNRNIRICIACTCLLVGMERKLYIIRKVLCRNRQLHSSHQIGTAGILKVFLCIPNGCPSIAAISGNFHSQRHITIHNTIAEESIIKGQQRIQPRQINNR